MNNITYQIEKAKATLRGAMEAINSGKLIEWEMKEFQIVRRESIATIKKWISIKNEVMAQ